MIGCLLVRNVAVLESVVPCISKCFIVSYILCDMVRERTLARRTFCRCQYLTVGSSFVLCNFHQSHL